MNHRSTLLIGMALSIMDHGISHGFPNDGRGFGGGRSPIPPPLSDPKEERRLRKQAALAEERERNALDSAEQKRIRKAEKKAADIAKSKLKNNCSK